MTANSSQEDAMTVHVNREQIDNLMPDSVPPLNSTSGKPVTSVEVHLHLGHSDEPMDWYITEYDPESRVAWGWFQEKDREAEEGYIYVEEFVGARDHDDNNYDFAVIEYPETHGLRLTQVEGLSQNLPAYAFAAREETRPSHAYEETVEEDVAGPSM